MAVAAEFTPAKGYGVEVSFTVKWEGLVNGAAAVANGAPYEQYAHGKIGSFQVMGTFGAGGSLRIMGSNDGETWAVLTDPQGNDLVFTTAKIERSDVVTRYVRPEVTAGDGSTLLDVILLASRGG